MSVENGVKKNKLIYRRWLYVPGLIILAALCFSPFIAGAGDLPQDGGNMGTVEEPAGVPGNEMYMGEEDPEENPASLVSIDNPEEHYRSNDELVADLDQLVIDSDGKIELEIIGQSNLGRDIYMATVGTGDIPIVLFAQVHGYERTCCKSLMQLLEELGTSDDPVIENILDELTIYIMPRVNMDGAAHDVQTYENIDPNVPPPWSEMGVRTRYRGGWNISSYHVANWEDHPLSDYEEPALVWEPDGFEAGKVFTNSVDYEGVEGLLIDCGKGAGAADFPASVDGNLALIEVGGGTFDAVVQNAIGAGAVGAVFYQDQDYSQSDEDNFLPRFGLSSSASIPVMAIPRPGALDLLAETDPVHVEIIKNTYPENPATEIIPVVDLILDVEPLWLLDVHGHRATIGPNGKTTTSALIWPEIDIALDEVVDLGKQITWVMADSVNSKYSYADVTLYHQRTPTHPTGSRNAYAHLGITSVLFELWNDRTRPFSDLVSDLAVEQMLTALEMTADESIHAVDPENVWNLAPFGPRSTHADCRENIWPTYMPYLYFTETLEEAIAAAEDFITGLPAAITLSDDEDVYHARTLVHKVEALGGEESDVDNIDVLLAAEDVIAGIYDNDYEIESLLELDSTGNSGLGNWISYDDYWWSEHTINGVCFLPLGMYTMSHWNLHTSTRWVDYDISGKDYRYIVGYAGASDRVHWDIEQPVTFQILLDGVVAYEVDLEYGMYADFYRLDVSQADTVRFNLFAEEAYADQYHNRLGIVEPRFLTPVIPIPVDELIDNAIDAIDDLPDPSAVTLEDIVEIEFARGLVEEALNAGASEADITNLGDLEAVEDALLALIEALDEVAAADNAIDALPAEIEIYDHEQIYDTRNLVHAVEALGVGESYISNIDVLLAAEEALEESYDRLYERESLFALGDPGTDNRSGLANWVDYPGRWWSEHTINGVCFLPLGMYTMSHWNLHESARWVEYDISDRDYKYIVGYAGSSDDVHRTTEDPVTFQVILDGVVAFEAVLEFGEYAHFYRLDVSGAEKIKFNLFAETAHLDQYHNRLGIVEPQFFIPRTGELIDEAIAAIDALPDIADLTPADIKAVEEARALVEDAIAAGASESDITNLDILVAAEEALKGLVLYGDVNGDGIVNVADVIMVMQSVLGIIQFDADQQEAADVNGDGIINVDDVVLIMQRILNLIDEFPVES